MLECCSHLMTLALELSMALRASAAFSALPSWMRPMVMLMITTAEMSAKSAQFCQGACRGGGGGGQQ